MRFFLILLFGAYCLSPVQAQLERTIHQSFELKGAQLIKLDLSWPCEIILWEGSNLMTETIILLFNASPAILNFLVENEKRYAIHTYVASDTFQLKSNLKKQEFIHTKNGVCREVVKIKVYAPKNYLESDFHPLVLSRKSDGN